MDEKVSQDDFAWSAPEFADSTKSAGWFGILAITTVLVAGLMFLLTRDLISTAMVFVAFICLGAFAARKPRQVSYRISDKGIDVGNRHHAFTEFRCFAFDPEGDVPGIILIPIKRFSPLTSVYFYQKDEEKIMDIVAAYLPITEHKRDIVESLMNRIHF